MRRPRPRSDTPVVLRAFAAAGAALLLSAGVWFAGCVVIWMLAQWWMDTLPPRRCGTSEMCATFGVLFLWTALCVLASLLATACAVLKRYGL